MHGGGCRFDPGRLHWIIPTGRHVAWDSMRQVVAVPDRPLPSGRDRSGPERMPGSPLIRRWSQLRQPTGEPTGEPTDEPTDEPADEPTDEPAGVG